jgi:cyanophycinase-like exopeptidase
LGASFTPTGTRLQQADRQPGKLTGSWAAQAVTGRSHFVERGRFARLMETGATNPERLGIGLGEDTGVIVHPGTVLETFGTGHVIVVDSRSIQHSNVADSSDGAAIAAANMILYGLIDGQGYDVHARTVLQADALAARLAQSTPEVAPSQPVAWTRPVRAR